MKYTFDQSIELGSSSNAIAKSSAGFDAGIFFSAAYLLDCLISADYLLMIRADFVLLEGAVHPVGDGWFLVQFGATEEDTQFHRTQ